MNSIKTFFGVTLPSFYKPSTYLPDIALDKRYDYNPEKQQSLQKWEAWQKVARNVAITAVVVLGVSFVGLCALQALGVVDLTPISMLFQVGSYALQGFEWMMTMGLAMPDTISNGGFWMQNIYKTMACVYNSTILLGVAPVPNFIPGSSIISFALMFTSFKVFKEGLGTLGLQMIMGALMQPVMELGKWTWEKAKTAVPEKIDEISEKIFNTMYNARIFNGGYYAPAPINGAEIIPAPAP